jgi:hypothetical protein
MSEEFVYVAIYSHKHGTDVAVYRTAEKAYEWREEIATTYWSDFYPDEPMPNENVSGEYFDGMAEIGGDEWFTIERKQVEV